MNILLLHAWLRGNLGDFCITDELVRFLRGRFPDAHIVLASEPCGEWRVPQSLLSFVDTFVERSYRDSADELIAASDVVINVPGGGLQDPGDSRGPFMLRDAETCHRLGIPHVFAGHSFHSSFPMDALHGSLVLAREPMSHSLLTSHGIPALLTADPAFLASSVVPNLTPTRAGTLLFLRWKHIQKISKEENVLTLDDRTVRVESNPLTLASSDPLRDDGVLEPIAKQYGLSYERCFNLSHLLRVIGSAEHVVSDRYHPIIFAYRLGVPYTFLQRTGSLRDEGLQMLLREKSASELVRLAEGGFLAMGDFLKS